MTVETIMNKDNINGHAEADQKKSPWGPSPTQRTTGNQEMLGVGEIAFPKEEQYQLVIQYQWLALKTYTK